MLYKMFNGATPTTSAFAFKAFTTALLTTQQLKATNSIKVVAWGCMLDVPLTGAGVQVELIDTGTVNATVTASVDADIFKWQAGADQAAAAAAGVTLATSGTGYTSSAEGSITVVKTFDVTMLNSVYAWAFDLGREPILIPGNILRVRVKSAVSSGNILTWILFDI